ncbi:Transmembrane domain-containing protein [Orpheovirus IHUMI-LCC2]|uniref:Transmembrane domain-containing protein n=1 Tax=Orpheovirus IHUMI-LCC2 TaxID=2023057 RepID=A0A2I2L6B7_9VIRU|nr:Transmembrane domain-containing protein [Orpheovirus IHUMI-LCC2]SNW63040.1 Transmembrane domain-containing protein [Orpheovirus IHUMI-LCC2]
MAEVWTLFLIYIAVIVLTFLILWYINYCRLEWNIFFSLLIGAIVVLFWTFTNRICSKKAKRLLGFISIIAYLLPIIILIWIILTRSTDMETECQSFVQYECEGDVCEIVKKEVICYGPDGVSKSCYNFTPI